MLQGAIISYEETGFLQHFAEGQIYPGAWDEQ